MSASYAVSRKPPKFATNAKGKPTSVTLEAASYVTLLIRAGVTDASQWPPGMEEGAVALARVRAIEKRCAARHGGFDWEKLSPKLQDEYDSLTGLLDELQDTGERVPLRELLRAEEEARG